MWLDTQSADSSSYHASVIAEMLSMVINTDGATMILKDPKNLYTGSLKPTLERIRALEKEGQAGIAQARSAILERLQGIRQQVVIATDQLDWYALPVLISHPDDEFKPQITRARYLYVWPENEHGQTLDQFACLCLALYWANAQLELPLTNMEGEQTDA